MKQHLQNIRNNYIRYAQCWEDADILLAGLNPREGDNILSVGSAGDNSFSLLLNNPKQVVVMDINELQLKLIKLKMAAINTLDRNGYLEFAGYKNSVNRKNFINQVLKGLDEESGEFWRQNMDLLEKGIIHSGKFEKYFKLFRKYVLSFVHRSKRVDQLFTLKTEGHQSKFYYRKWDTILWRLMFKLFFSKYIMGRFGRDAEFLKHVDLNVGQFIYERAAQHLSSEYCPKNYLLKYIMKGEFGNSLPHYVRVENYEIIKKNIDKIVLSKGLIEDVGTNKYGPFDCFNLSNIFEYMSSDMFECTTKKLLRMGNANARYAYWNLMVPRRLSAQYADGFSYEKQTSEKLSFIDRGFFYKEFLVDIKIAG